MTLTLFALLALALVLLALTGPRLVRWSTPLLMRAPRLASGLLLGALAVWSTAAVVLGVALAGLPSGPRLLAGSAADVCQRCLAAASPFSAAPVELPVPMAALVLLPLAGTALMGAAAVRGLRRRSRATRAVLAEVRATAVRTVLAGHPVLLFPDPTPRAFALPRRRGGIVVSHGLLESLGPDELSAVLEHEAAHLSQHHHTLLAVLEAMVGPLRVIPLFDAVATAVPHLLEIAADDASRHRSGTPALASALLTLGEAGAPGTSAAPAAVPGTLLHMTGSAGVVPDRIGHLVSPAAARSALVPVLTLSTLLVTLLGVAAAVVVPYAVLLWNGCPLLR
ncbi:Zn-dependent protease with chaperone function [Brachybacterium vulturis]|uniref:Zn-dependent protease with chaperone function n=1 Tax=Brachybacterium vulturis TaxID=2017484 RepID=A0A291GS16_9MICO|nr:M56 family metallopeptidase [Brachybacterium vulturis]ATG52910.1 Zn-dependent protease with chaperone function [Brachybacterium vulturis]